MAIMTSQEIALQYFKRLLKASNPKAELEKILSDINSLILSDSDKPVDSVTKIRVIDELEKLIKKSQRPSTRSFDEFKAFSGFKRSIGKAQASDNSDILDVISAMKKKVS